MRPGAPVAGGEQLCAGVGQDQTCVAFGDPRFVSGIGDRSTDYNFYTKRALLAGVISSTALYWLEDKSAGCTDSWAFLDRRIADVMKIPQAMARFGKLRDKLPNPFRFLRRRPAR